eukprot:COSAG05_NODE_398_length_10293_cov_11.919176_5_plen_96_part_00
MPFFAAMEILNNLYANNRPHYARNCMLTYLVESISLQAELEQAVGHIEQAALATDVAEQLGRSLQRERRRAGDLHVQKQTLQVPLVACSPFMDLF